MAFAVAQLEKNPRMAFGDLKAMAEKRGLSVLPIVYGRAKKALGLQRRGGKPGRRVAPGRVALRPQGSASPGRARRGRPPKSGATSPGEGDIGRLMELVQQAELHRQALEQIQAIIEGALKPNRPRGRPRKS
ncbi:MAG: hypothetical protein KA712_17860 [Myxococcales bacterium]|nr:hypothetical protein [Myxococcales bacterium]